MAVPARVSSSDDRAIQALRMGGQGSSAEQGSVACWPQLAKRAAMPPAGSRVAPPRGPHRASSSPSPLVVGVGGGCRFQAAQPTPAGNPGHVLGFRLELPLAVVRSFEE